MPPTPAIKLWREDGLQNRLPETWRSPLARAGLIWGALIFLMRHDWAVMLGKWWNVSTYNHVLFVPPIIIWLIWVRRNALAQLAPQPWWPGLIALGGALFLWLLGSIAGVNTASQLGAVAALQASVLALLGLRVAAGILFPLCFMVFLVPFGDELVPALQMITAQLVIFLTHWSGIPAVIQGVFIETPAGLFEVAEACSGVKFLVAMMALGALVAHTCFRSPVRRFWFLLAAMAIPVIANGVRAWGTIYIAQSQGIAFAEGFDHIFYGWVFFALVVAALLGGAWRWFDRAADDLDPDIAAINNSPLISRLSARSMPGNRALGAALALVMLFAMWAVLATRAEAALPKAAQLPPVPGWQLVDYTPSTPWEPRAAGAAHRLIGRYRNPAGDEVDVFIALYASQGDGREASAFGEGALRPDTPWRWLGRGQSSSTVQADYLLALGQFRRLAETSYRIGGLTTGSAVRLKLATMRDHLLLQQRPTILAIISAEEQGPVNAAQSITEFRSALGDEGQWMDRIAGLR